MNEHEQREPETPEPGAGSAAGDPESVPLGQRLYDNWWLLLLAGLAVMAVTYTAWGLVEIVTLPQATLP